MAILKPGAKAPLYWGLVSAGLKSSSPLLKQGAPTKRQELKRQQAD
jgi:hypothetical protein